jgi:hypothetical protein
MKNTIIFFATAAALVIACNHEDTPARSANTTGAYAVNNQEAVRKLTDARCERAKACNQLGEKEKYADEAACKRENRHDLESDYRVGECPGGVRENKLDHCLQEIRNEKCGNPFDKISRLETCRTGALCID